MIAISFATFSIVDEKLSGSLEALLATPVRTWELLLGKALSGAVPALVITWVCAGVFILGVVGLGWGQLVNLVLTSSWLVWFTPLLTLILALGVSLVDILVLRVAVGLFQRESIVVKWH